MRIGIEYKDKKYTITYGKLTGIGASMNEALEKLIEAFKQEVGKFFTLSQ